MQIEEIIDNFKFLDTWEDKYRYIIEIGEQLPELPDYCRTDEWKVKGCQSQVWLFPQKKSDGTLFFKGYSDAIIVRGLVGIVLAIYNNKTPQTIIDTDIDGIFSALGLHEHLSPSRRNGLEAMIEKVKHYATLMTYGS